MHKKPILMHRSPTINFGDVANKLISKERRLTSEGKSSDTSVYLWLKVGRRETPRKKSLAGTIGNLDI